MRNAVIKEGWVDMFTLSNCVRESVLIPCLLWVFACTSAAQVPDAPAPPSMSAVGGVFGENPFATMPRPKPAETARRTASTPNFPFGSLEVEMIVARGLEYRNCKQYALAFAEIDQALQKEPERVYLYSTRAFLRAMTMRQGDAVAIAAAENDLRLARPSPADDDGFARGVRGMILARQNKFREAIPDLTWAIEHMNDSPEIRMYRGIAYSYSQEEKNALADFEDVVRRDPSILQAYWYMAAIHDRLGEWKEILAIHEAVLKRRPDDLQVRLSRMMLALDHREYEIALADLDRLLTLKHGNAEWYFDRACLRWVCKRDLALIKSDLERAIELDSTNWEFPATRVALYIRNSNYRYALADLGRCLLLLSHTEFRVMWKVEWDGDEPERIFLGWVSHYKPAAATTNHPRTSTDKIDCLLGSGLAALFNSALGWSLPGVAH
jgi:tetratricopeptide (TPR) repeat protein